MRDSGWMLVQALRYFGIAARFVSGYLIQLVADQKALDGPSGTRQGFHRPAHGPKPVYRLARGWVGLDPTSGLLAGEGHIPLACDCHPASSATRGRFHRCLQITLDFEMTVTRIHEDPRVTKPYSDAQWREIEALGERIDGTWRPMCV